MIASRFRHRRRRLWLPIGTGVTLASVLLFVIGTAGSANLTGSHFEIDTPSANLVVDGTSPSPSIDWLNTAGTAMRTGVVVKPDKPTGSGDDSFGQGTSEADPIPTVTDGSIPPNKSDLTNFGIYVEKTASGSFMNLFWTRVQDPVGSTNMDFEFNQSSTLSSNGVTPVRTSGDLLIEYHLANGGTVVTLTLRTWDGSVWGPAVALSGSSIGSINTTIIVATDSGGLGSLSPRTFGEASIDLAAILPSGQCKTFGSAYLKSRASDSFTSAIKDFIAPLTANVTNCGSVLVQKNDNNSNALAGAAFTVTPGQLTASGQNTSDTIPAVANHTGLFCIENMAFGTVTVHESTTPTGYDPGADQTFTVTDNGTCAARVAATASPDLTFVNIPKVGAIKITKTGKDKRCVGPNDPDANCSASATRLLAGAVFAIKQGTTVVATSVATDANGVTCVSGLPLGTYDIEETTTPANYQTAAKVTGVVVAQGTCSSSPVLQSIVDQPLSKIQVKFTPFATGSTTSSIVCAKGATTKAADSENGSVDPAQDDTDETFSSLDPGTYTCTIIIDP